MARRSGRSAFAPDAFVFPGGALEAADLAAELRAQSLGLEAPRLRREFRVDTSDEPVEAFDPDHAAGLFLAGLRELFEESGVLIACDQHGAALDAPILARAGVGGAREALIGGTRAFADILHEHAWFADARALAYFSHWVTPPNQPRRFDTHFFFASAPPDQAARSDEREVYDGLWIAPQAALERHRNGEFHLVYPTIKHLERLLPFGSVDEALSFARSKPIRTVAPSAHPDDGYAMPPSLESAW